MTLIIGTKFCNFSTQQISQVLLTISQTTPYLQQKVTIIIFAEDLILGRMELNMGIYKHYARIETRHQSMGSESNYLQSFILNWSISKLIWRQVEATSSNVKLTFDSTNYCLRLFFASTMFIQTTIHNYPQLKVTLRYMYVSIDN